MKNKARHYDTTDGMGRGQVSPHFHDAEEAVRKFEKVAAELSTAIIEMEKDWEQYKAVGEPNDDRRS